VQVAGVPPPSAGRGEKKPAAALRAQGQANLRALKTRHKPGAPVGESPNLPSGRGWK